jgi:sigma-B regulation protein RsbU (phosphoserine phosphatase)
MSEPREIIAFVDDEPQVLRALEREMGDFCRNLGLEVQSFESAARCRDAIAKKPEHYAIVISDLRMPGTKGSDFLLQLHADYPDIGLMLLTAYNDIGDIQKAISASVRALIMKPWNPAILEAEIEDALEVRRIRRENREYLEKINHQLDQAAEFQKNLLDTRIPEINNARLSLTYLPHPSMKIGGDYYDIIQIDKKRFIAMIGDVTGHGIRPSFVTAMIKVITLALGKPREDSQVDAGKFLTALNRQLCKILENASDILMTFTCLVIDTGTMTMQVANAGHLPVYLVNDGGESEYKAEGPAMGFSADVTYEAIEVKLAKGDTVAVYTDGLLETRHAHSKINSEAIKRFFRLAKVGGEFNKTFISQLKMVRGEDEFFDDVTLLSIEF